MNVNPPKTETPITRLLDPETITIDVVDAAELLGISRPHCYHTIAETGVLAGINAIRIGSRIKIPAEPMRRLLGISANNTQSDHNDEIEVDRGRQSV
jgi:predicted DNA-binding transcriptional regulator AlpA